MRQAEKTHLIFDLQLFADEAEAPEQPQETQEQPQAQAETQVAEDTASNGATLDYSKLGQMSQDEQLAALSKAGVFGDGKPAEKPKEQPQQTEKTEHEQTGGQAEKAPQEVNEPEYEVVVDGQKVKVKQ